MNTELLAYQFKNQYPSAEIYYEAQGIPYRLELTHGHDLIRLTVYPYIAFKEVYDGFGHSLKEYR